MKNLNDSYSSSQRHLDIQDKKARQSDRRFVAGNAKSAFSILGIVFLLIFGAVLIRRFSDNDTIPTFESLLSFLTTIKSFKIPFVDFATVGFFASDWGLLNVLRDFFAGFSNLFNVIIFLLNGIIILCQYTVIFLRWFFVF